MSLRHIRRAPAITAVLALSAIVAGVVMIASGAMAATQQVTVKGFAFNPASIQVNVGDSITWTNQDSAAHTVTADDGSFDKPLPGSGGTATITFNTAGTFPYHCTIHPNMHGTVVVLAAASSGGSTNTPATGGSSASPTSGAAASPTAAPPATGSGVAPAGSWSPLIVLFGGLLVALGLGGGVLALQRMR